GSDRARRRGPHPGLLTILARRLVGARGPAAELRQAVRAGLVDLLRLGPSRRRAPAAAPGRRRRTDPGPLPRGLRAPHGRAPDPALTRAPAPPGTRRPRPPTPPATPHAR